MAAPRTAVDLNALSRIVLDCSFRVHTALGPGLLESAYQGCLLHELRQSKVSAASEVVLPVNYNGVKIDLGYRIDLLIEDSIILELKAIEKLTPIHHAQLLSYLKLSGKQLGFLMNFNVRISKMASSVSSMISRNLVLSFLCALRGERNL